jgi:hypothetical protein
MTKVFKLRKLQVICDRKRVIPNDPGADTPAMVYYRKYGLEASATLWCAMGEGELQITYPRNVSGVHRLTDHQIEWLESIEPKVNEFLYETV